MVLFLRVYLTSGIWEIKNTLSISPYPSVGFLEAFFFFFFFFSSAISTLPFLKLNFFILITLYPVLPFLSPGDAKSEKAGWGKQGQQGKKEAILGSLLLSAPHNQSISQSCPAANKYLLVLISSFLSPSYCLC